MNTKYFRRYFYVLIVVWENILWTNLLIFLLLYYRLSIIFYFSSVDHILDTRVALITKHYCVNFTIQTSFCYSCISSWGCLIMHLTIFTLFISNWLIGIGNTCQSLCGGQKILCWNHCSPSSIRVLGIEVRFLLLTAWSFNSWTISLTIIGF